MREELDSLLIGVIVAFMFGWFGPVRPGALISLCHPVYQVSDRRDWWLCTSTKQHKVFAHHKLLTLHCVNMQGPCTHPDCIHPRACSQNRFFFDERGDLCVVWVRHIVFEYSPCKAVPWFPTTRPPAAGSPQECNTS